MKRGALIIIEGVDRTGKSTQARMLVENLKKKNIQAEYTNFPARDTEVGKIINNYLQLKNELSDEVVHLLFSANRWERAKSIIKTLEAGITVIVDRYCYSGVAFSAAKGNIILYFKFIISSVHYKVFFLTMPVDSIKQRNGFGNERYEVLSFQQKVSEIYSKLKEDNWEIVDASRPIDTIQEDMLEQTLNIVNVASDKNIEKLWTQG
ncbi:hypothetical protein HW555_002992 [Spodoptera exigua]|uniref:Thymidylate kinase n=1 Tax=Spodoptera exigua TaxID=7107 RepID=A0A835L7I7_SPOEX|nr:hypothetical protein HW555_002992 [Spodoptera exigua]